MWLGQLQVSICPFANVTGHPCPGCGLTRAMLALLSLDFGEALRLHPLSPLLGPLLAWFLVPGMWRFVVGVAPPPPVQSASTRRREAFVFGAIVLSMLLVWGLRFLGYLGGPVEVHPLWR